LSRLYFYLKACLLGHQENSIDNNFVAGLFIVVIKNILLLAFELLQLHIPAFLSLAIPDIPPAVSTFPQFAFSQPAACPLH
jgi:hypothetical protein